MSLEILGLGCVALDETLAVEAFPTEDAKIAVGGRSVRLGGITASALAAAAKLGMTCGFAGTLGHGDASRRVLDEFARAGVDTSLVRRQAGAEPIRATIIVSRRTGSRTVFYDLTGAVGATTDWPPEEAIRSASVLLIDHFGMEGMLRAAKIAADAGVPVVATFERHERPEFAELLALVDHLIVGSDFAHDVTGAAAPANAVQRLWSPRRQAVVVTCGAGGCWFRAACGPHEPQHVPAIPVEARDTTGCGDVFRGAYAAALLHFYSAPTLTWVRYAAAAAARSAAAITPEDRFPARSAVEDLFARTWPIP
jgi:sugar/nucleoside kinase (ribokinase family)